MKAMKMKTVLKALTGGCVLGLQMACTQTVIVFKPSPFLDPMPEIVRGQTGEPAADPRLGDQWNLAKVGLNEQTLRGNEFAGSPNVRVVILSTGIDYNHEDLVGQVAINRREITNDTPGQRPGVNRTDDDGNGLVDDVVGWDVVDGDGFAYDRHGAGTAVAGIIAARQNNGKGVAGLMRNVSLFPVRYINDNGQTSVANLVAALDVAVKSRPDVVFVQTTQIALGGHEQNAAVIQVELQLLEQHLKKLQERKVPVVLGAGDDLGNFGAQEIDKILRRYENVVVVTASDKADALPLMANVDFENVKTMAPGEEILTTMPGNKYGTVHGTAYAAAHVAAAYALAKSQFGDRLTYEDYNPVLISARGGDLVRGMERFSRGGNRLNIPKFLTALRTR